MRLCLENGLDESSTDRMQFEERGATFESPWEFQLAAELMMCLAWSHPRFGPQRTPVTGVVVQSTKVCDGRYETVVFFPDLPEANRAGLRAFHKHLW